MDMMVTSEWRQWAERSNHGATATVSPTRVKISSSTWFALEFYPKRSLCPENIYGTNILLKTWCNRGHENAINVVQMCASERKQIAELFVIWNRVRNGCAPNARNSGNGYNYHWESQS
jgi:hypothetical protein